MNKKTHKILQLGKFYPIGGGVEKVMYDLMTGLSSEGVECDMLCAAVDGKPRTHTLHPNAKLMCCGSLGKFAATMISPSMINKLRSICNDYDIIHVHHPDPMAAIALRLSGYKGTVVLHWHSDIVRQKQFLKLYMPLQNWLIKRADLIIGTSPVYLQGSKYLSEVQYKTISLPIGVEPMTVDPATTRAIRQRYGNRKIVFSLGRLVPYKGFTFLIDAAGHLPDDYVVLIGGTGPLQHELEQQIQRKGLGDKVKLLGHISDEELPSYYDACRVFCLSSVQKSEAFAIVQIEAMAFGKPIVATRIPRSGVAWVNSHGDSGINVTPGSGAELAKAIMDITTDDTVYEAFSNRAKRRYESMFTKKIMIENCKNIYQDLWKK